MTKAECLVLQYSAAIRRAKISGETDVIEFMLPLYQRAVRQLMREWDEEDRSSNTAA